MTGELSNRATTPSSTPSVKPCHESYVVKSMETHEPMSPGILFKVDDMVVIVDNQSPRSVMEYGLSH